MLSSLVYQECVLLKVFKWGYIYIAIVTYLVNIPTFPHICEIYLYYLLHVFTWKDLFPEHVFLSISLIDLSRLCIQFPHHALKYNYCFIVCMLEYLSTHGRIHGPVTSASPGSLLENWLLDSSPNNWIKIYILKKGPPVIWVSI